jgi:hypothetical protein
MPEGVGRFLPSCIAYGKIIPQRIPVIFGLFLSHCIAYGKTFRNKAPPFSDYFYHIVLPKAK